MPARGNRAATLAQFKLSPDGEGRSLPVVSVVKPCCCYYYYNSHTYTRIVYAKCGKMLKKEELSTVKRVKQLQNQFACTRKDRERERECGRQLMCERENKSGRERNYRKNQKNVTTYTKFSVAQRRRRRRRRSMSAELSGATLTVVQRFATELDVCTFVWVFSLLISAANLAILPSSLAFFNENIVNKAYLACF